MNHLRHKTHPRRTYRRHAQRHRGTQFRKRREFERVMNLIRTWYDQSVAPHMQELAPTNAIQDTDNHISNVGQST